MINTAVIMGRLTHDPEMRKTPAGVSVARFSVAVERPYSKDGERQTDFLDVVAWRPGGHFAVCCFSWCPSLSPPLCPHYTTLVV